MVFVNIFMSGKLTESKFNAIKEQLPQIAQQLGLKIKATSTDRLEYGD